MPPSRLAPTLPGALRAAAEHDPGRPALTDGQRSLTYGDLAGLLEEDPEGHPGEVRALDAGDPFELVVDLVRLTAGGAAVAPIDPELPTAAREAMCARLHPVDPVRPGGAGPDPDDVALVIATSGTTARPTLVEQTHRNLRVSAEGARDRLRVTPEDGVLALTPFSHVLALRATLDGLWIGSTVVLLRGAATGGRLEAMVEGIEHPATTYVSGSPAALEALAAVYERRSPPSGLRLVRSGGAPLSALSQERIQAALGVPVLVGYGMTQAAKIATPAFPPDPADAGTVGRPLVELQIVDDAGAQVRPGETGRILVRGDGVCRRSHDGGVDLLDADGWLDTGDLGHLRDGRLVLVGRIDHVINRGGEQVSPLAVEQALVGHADVAEALVTGVAAGRGSTVAALVTAADGRSPAPGDLQDWLAPRLSPNQRPSVIRVVEALPRDGKGAPDRRAAARLLTERAEVPSTGPEAPASSAEVSALWQALLGVDGTGFGPDDDFFAVGGDSLLALELAERLSELSGAEVAPGLALRLRTVAEQAAWLDRQRTEGARPEEAVVRHAGPGDGPTVVLLPGSGGTATGTRPIADAIHRRLPRAHVVTVEIPVRHGAPLVGVDEIADAAVASLVAAGLHPSVVVGVSFGSLVAVEVVRRLGTGADGIAQVVLVDLPRVQPPATGTSRARTAARILWSGRGVLPLRRLGTLLRPVRPLGEGALPEVPAGWRTVARRRAELARTSSTSPVRGGPAFVVVATLRQVRRTRDATLGWRGTLRPLGVRLAVSNHERLLTVDAHLVAEAVDADALGTR